MISAAAEPGRPVLSRRKCILGPMRASDRERRKDDLPEPLSPSTTFHPACWPLGARHSIDSMERTFRITRRRTNINRHFVMGKRKRIGGAAQSSLDAGRRGIRTNITSAIADARTSGFCSAIDRNWASQAEANARDGSCSVVLSGVQS